MKVTAHAFLKQLRANVKEGLVPGVSKHVLPYIEKRVYWGPDNDENVVETKLHVENCVGTVVIDGDVIQRIDISEHVLYGQGEAVLRTFRGLGGGQTTNPDVDVEKAYTLLCVPRRTEGSRHSAERGSRGLISPSRPGDMGLDQLIPEGHRQGGLGEERERGRAIRMRWRCWIGKHDWSRWAADPLGHSATRSCYRCWVVQRKWWVQ